MIVLPGPAGSFLWCFRTREVARIERDRAKRVELKCSPIKARTVSVEELKRGEVDPRVAAARDLVKLFGMESDASAQEQP